MAAERWKLTPVVALLFFAGCSGKKEAPKPVLNISGTIEIDPALAKQTAESDTLFLIARPATGGPPLAVKRFTGKAYPYAFTLQTEDLMIQQEAVDVPLDLTVRVDKDGDAMTRKPGDLTGGYEKNPVSLEASGVVITVKQRME